MARNDAAMLNPIVLGYVAIWVSGYVSSSLGLMLSSIMIADTEGLKRFVRGGSMLILT